MKKKSTTNSRILNFLAVKLVCLLCAATMSAQDSKNASASTTETKKPATIAQQTAVVQPTAAVLGEDKSKTVAADTSDREKELSVRVEQLEREVKELRAMQQQQLNGLQTSIASLKPVAPESSAAVALTARIIPTMTRRGKQRAMADRAKDALLDIQAVRRHQPSRRH